MNRIARLAGALAAASLGLAAPSFAQMYGPPGGGMPQGGPNGPGMSRGYGRPSGANVDQSLASLHSRLSVRPDQESAWEGFANAVRQQTRQMQSMQGSMLRPPATAPERLAQMAQFMQQRAAGMGAVAQALAKLYAALDENQRSIVDEEFAPPPSGMGGGPPIR